MEVLAGGSATANFGVQASHVYRVSGTVIGLSAPPKAQSIASGTVMLMTGQGMGQISLIGKNGQTKEQNLREDGIFEFTGVLAGTYRAQLVVFSGFSNGQPSIRMQTIRTPIEVNGSDVRGLQLQVEAGGDVRGKFRMEGNEKIDWKELFVSLVPKSEGEPENTRVMMPMGQATPNEDGSFEIKDVPAGDCQLGVGASSDKFRDYYTRSCCSVDARWLIRDSQLAREWCWMWW